MMVNKINNGWVRVRVAKSLHEIQWISLDFMTKEFLMETHL